MYQVTNNSSYPPYDSYYEVDWRNFNIPSFMDMPIVIHTDQQIKLIQGLNRIDNYLMNNRFIRSMTRRQFFDQIHLNVVHMNCWECYFPPGTICDNHPNIISSDQIVLYQNTTIVDQIDQILDWYIVYGEKSDDDQFKEVVSHLIEMKYEISDHQIIGLLKRNEQIIKIIPDTRLVDSVAEYCLANIQMDKKSFIGNNLYINNLYINDQANDLIKRIAQLNPWYVANNAVSLGLSENMMKQLLSEYPQIFIYLNEKIKEKFYVQFIENKNTTMKMISCLSSEDINSVDHSTLLVKNFPYAIQMIRFKNITEKLCHLAIASDPLSIKKIPIKFMSKNLIMDSIKNVDKQFYEEIINIIPMSLYDDDICILLIGRFGIDVLPRHLICHKFIEYHLTLYQDINLEINVIRKQFIINATHFIKQCPKIWLRHMTIFEKDVDMDINMDIKQMKTLLIIAINNGLSIESVPTRWIDQQVLIDVVAGLNSDQKIPQELMSDLIYIEMLKKNKITYTDIPDEYHTVELMRAIWTIDKNAGSIYPTITNQSLI